MIALVDLPRKLREITGGSAPVPSYRVLYREILDGALAAERRNGRWVVAESVAHDLARRLVAA